eukprot:GHVP01036919.1.p1 GENE.GHVP01036919.1~~GHVP01036919.1.p1  ORF type:complete len:560 (+),score=176.38 GHVP01036919.1:552-2231(+)
MWEKLKAVNDESGITKSSLSVAPPEEIIADLDNSDFNKNEALSKRIVGHLEAVRRFRPLWTSNEDTRENVEQTTKKIQVGFPMQLVQEMFPSELSKCPEEHWNQKGSFLLKKMWAEKKATAINILLESEIVDEDGDIINPFEIEEICWHAYPEMKEEWDRTFSSKIEDNELIQKLTPQLEQAGLCMTLDFTEPKSGSVSLVGEGTEESEIKNDNFHSETHLQETPDDQKTEEKTRRSSKVIYEDEEVILEEDDDEDEEETQVDRFILTRITDLGRSDSPTIPSKTSDFEKLSQIISPQKKDLCENEKDDQDLYQDVGDDKDLNQDVNDDKDLNQDVDDDKDLYQDVDDKDLNQDDYKEVEDEDDEAPNEDDDIKKDGTTRQDEALNGYDELSSDGFSRKSKQKPRIFSDEVIKPIGDFRLEMKNVFSEDVEVSDGEGNLLDSDGEEEDGEMDEAMEDLVDDKRIKETSKQKAEVLDFHRKELEKLEDEKMKELFTFEGVRKKRNKIGLQGDDLFDEDLEESDRILRRGNKKDTWDEVYSDDDSYTDSDDEQDLQIEGKI